MKIGVIILLSLLVNIESKRKHHRRRHKLTANNEASETVPYNYAYPTTSVDSHQLTSTDAKAENDRSNVQPDQQKTQWKNHTIPYLKEYMEEIGEGKVKHHNYESLTWFMKFYAEEYPEIARMYEIGTTVQNRKMWVMEISDNVGFHEPGEPEMKYIGNVHGNEVIGREILLQLIKYLCENYGKDEKVTDLVDKTRIHILPSMNPDGYELAAARKKSESPDVTEDVIGRLNANGVDLNRNFPDQFFELNTETFEPETAAVISWIKKYPFTLSASFHSGALVVTYPFDDSPSGQSAYSATPDDDLFRQIAKSYSENHPQMHLANPKMNCTHALKRFTDGISNGAAWSSLNGGMQDYNYVRSNCYEVTVELGCHKFPREEDLESYWRDNKKPLIKFIEMASKGIKGFVKDENGNSIKGARISIGDRKHDIRSAEDGDYWRLLVPGTYEVECRAKGFHAVSKNVEVGTGDAVFVNFTMVPKVEDELEATLGHVNKATFITHDVMYRYDGRDSGNAVPKEVIKSVEEQQAGREGVTEVHEATNSEDSFGSGSGLDEATQAQKLAESLAINTVPISKSMRHSHAAKRIYEREYVPIPKEKRAKISRPEKKKMKVEKKNKKSSKSKTTAKNLMGIKGAANNTSNTSSIEKQQDQKNGSNATDNENVLKAVESMFHIKPSIGMHVRCKITGKSEPIKGTLKYMGHIKNLPKKSNIIVAGIELDHEEDLGTDGTFLGKRYFISPSKKGYFVPMKNCSPV
ncbi:carboxypeptidase D [Hydra vulgaris]|uniref:Carboxypeptidase D n=1 Tax=Hydra vulgaris TaxID=6087 RepID=A0ABM4C6L2_HYDVU